MTALTADDGKPRCSRRFTGARPREYSPSIDLQAAFSAVHAPQAGPLNWGENPQRRIVTLSPLHLVTPSSPTPRATTPMSRYNPPLDRTGILSEIAVSGVGNAYLQPYLKAARQHGAGFGTLLWASPRTQRTRFDAIRLMADPTGRRVLDAGCGRGDYLAYLIESGIWPAQYIGIDGVEELAGAAEARQFPNATILAADFVTEPPGFLSAPTSSCSADRSIR